MSIISHNVRVEKKADGRIMHVSISGKLTRDDYEVFVPDIDENVKLHGQVRLLFDFVGMIGFSLGALFEDTKFAFKHYRSIDRLAIVGDKRWEEAMAKMCRPFTKAEVNYYDISELGRAKSWLSEGL